MKPVRPEEILRMARLAQLQLRDDELPALTSELGAILTLVAQISTPDGPDADGPMADEGTPKPSPRRADEPRSAQREPLLSEAPELVRGLFRTPGAF